MSKIADKYFKVDSWKIIEEGFNPDYGEVSESIFSLGNEYMGVRGYFEEGYNGPKQSEVILMEYMKEQSRITDIIKVL